MINTNTIIKETIEELLKKMSFEGDVVLDSFDKDSVLANIQTNQAGYLIGQSGANLDALQFLARIMVNKKNEESIRFILDVNSYRKDRINFLRDLAQNIAKKTLLDKVEVTLCPMSAYERRVIHLALAENSEVNTESVGDGLERKIIVKPAKY